MPHSAETTAEHTFTQRIFAALVHPPAQGRFVSALIVIGVTASISTLYVVSKGEFARQAFYVIPMILAVSWLGLWWGLSIAFFSAFVRLYGDFAFKGVSISKTGDVYAAAADRLSLLLVNIVIIVVLNELYQLARQLEIRVQKRTTALEEAVAARERLKSSLFEAGLRERAAIGRDLHDGLGQHLTATAMAANILVKRLSPQNAALAADAREVERLIKLGIDQSRQIARGILLESVNPDELFSELEELAVATTNDNQTPCILKTEGSTQQLDVNIASHVFYIAREAVRNAVRHGGATSISIHFNVSNTIAALMVTDNGRGLRADDEVNGGMGIKIMSQRAELIGGALRVESARGGGTCLDCRIPLSATV